MSPKRRRKVTETPDTCKVAFDLKSYSLRKIFDILFLVAEDEYSNEELKEIIKTARPYEELTCLTFITYEDVLKFLSDSDTSGFPESLKECSVEVFQNVKEILDSNLEVPPIIMAQILKLKLVDHMHQYQIKALEKLQKTLLLENELKLLTKECKKGEKTKQAPVDKEKNIKEKVEEKKDFNISDMVAETENSIVFDDDVYNHVWFYVFQGFNNPQVMKLISYTCKIPITAVIKINIKNDKKTNHPNDISYIHIWNKLCDYFKVHQSQRIFDNSMLMKFTSCGTDYKEIFEELVYKIKNISDIKLQHLNYIRHIKIYQPMQEYPCIPLECLYTYNSFIDVLPCELINELVVLSSLLEEVNSRFSHNRPSENVLYLKSISAKGTPLRRNDNRGCSNPCDIHHIFKITQNLIKQNFVKETVSNFLAYEDDLMKIISKSYKKHGSLLCDLMICVGNKVKSLDLLKTDYEFDDISHKHDMDPSTNVQQENIDKKLHLMYLFLFSKFKYQNNRKPGFDIDELTENFEVYDSVEYWKSSQIEIMKDGLETEESAENYYDTLVTRYTWKEALSYDVLVQEVYRAENNYLYVENKVCSETDTILLLFSDRLDQFGINTEVFEETLTTPVCLRDFAKYILVEKKEWLENNRPPRYFRKQEKIEECQGARKINALNLFQCYRYLLDTGEEEEADSDSLREVKVKEDDRISFEKMLSELENYPSSENLIKECSKFPNPEFLAYDLGTDYFFVKGCRTTFVSHDNVKITVDNTRMISEEPKCTVNLSCRNNHLIVHSNNVFLQNDFHFHANLADGTIITFILYDNNKKQNMGLDIKGIAKEANELQDEKTENNVENDLIKNLEKINVTSTNRDYFIQKLKEKNELPSNLRSFDLYDLLTCLKYTEESPTLYKINDNSRYVNQLIPEVKIPITNILEGVLHTKTTRDENTYSKRYTSSNKQLSFSLKRDLDFRITLPNNIYVSCYPSEVKQGFVEVKQEYLTSQLDNNLTKVEEFRLFTRDGYILIKKTDGTVTIFMSNGDQITFEKPDIEDENITSSHLKECHCKNIEDYRKKLNKLFRKYSQENPYYVSRRGNIRTKKGYLIDENILKLLEDVKVPYRKISNLKYDGDVTCLEDNKITRKHEFHVTCEQDFSAEEIYFERSDGFQILFDRFGKQTVKFSDETKITSTVYVEQDLVDGFVFISLCFRYEHPGYVTVIYDFDNSLAIELNNEVVLQKNYDNLIKLKIDSDIHTTINRDSVVFNKTCEECMGSYRCEFNLKPFCIQYLDYNELFVSAQDTYNKQFYADFEGNCKRNSEFINGPFNNANCNHVSKNSYKQLFVVNRNYTGEQFWTDTEVETKRKMVVKDTNSSEIEITDYNGRHMLKFTKKVFEPYRYRFLNRSCIEQLCLTKNKKLLEPELVYSTYRIFQQIVDDEDVKNFCSELLNHMVKNNFKNESLVEGLRTVVNELDNFDKHTTNLFKRNQPEDDQSKECKCIKLKKSMSDKIKMWREECQKYRKIVRDKQFPPYFKSQFCQIID